MKLSFSLLALVSADARLRRESMGTVIVGDEGKWQKCADQLEEMDVNGEAHCEADVCTVMCMDGFVVEGSPKAKCMKKDGEWGFNKALGVCVEGEMEDGEKPDMEDHDDMEKPDMEDHDDMEKPDMPECEEGEDCEEMPDKPDMDKPMCEEDEDCEEMPDKPDMDKPMCEEGEDCEEWDGEWDGEKPDMDDDKPMCEEDDEECEEKPDMDGEKPEMGDMPPIFGDDGKWMKCEDSLEVVDNGTIHCVEDKCTLFCMDGYMVDGTMKAKCEKDKKGNWGFNKEFGTCVECGDDCPEKPEMPEMPDMEKPMCEEGDEECEEMPDKPMCEEGEECEEKPDMDGDNPDMDDDKPMCEEGDEECEEKPDMDGDKPDMDDDKPMCEEGDEECEEKPDMDGEKPEMGDMPAIFGDDGKWMKCEESMEPIEMGTVHCVDVKCTLFCMDGYMVEGNMKAKCEKDKKGNWAFNKDFGTCVECGDDCPEKPEMPEMPDMEKPMCEEGEECEEKPDMDDDKPMCEEGEECEEKPDMDDDKPMCEEGEDCEEMPDKPDDMEDEKPAIMGDDGKWTKCDEPKAVENGLIKCKKDTCQLKCDEGFEVEGSSKSKCVKDDEGNFAFNKALGECVGGDENEEEKPEDDEDENKPEDEEEAAENPGCKNLDDMLSEDAGLDVGCKVNKKNQFICALTCPEGTNFNGKDGKTGTKLICKCKNEKCKWQNEKKKTINGKTMAKYSCE